MAYVELHGTGSNIGDPTEVEGVSRVFRKDERHGATLIGSVKPNLGHGEASSGLLCIIKASLFLERRTILPTIGIKQMNSKFKARERGIHVTSMTPFLSVSRTRRISMHSFGFGGANAHVILEEANHQGARYPADRSLQ